MPVLGHAFVGVATAAYVRPRTCGLRAALWTPLLVGLAYLPDLVSQIGDLMGTGRWRVATHSVLFAFITAILLARPIAAAARLPRLAALALVLFSVLVHQAMDLLQGTDDRPFWPFSSWRADFAGWLPATGLKSEIVWIGGLCAILVAVRWLISRWRGEHRRQVQDDSLLTAPTGRQANVVGWLVTAVFLVLATWTHYLRDIHERQVAAAEALIHAHRPAEALPLLDRAAYWPHVKSPAALDYVRGEAYDAMGDRPRAEQYYLAALRDGAEDIWALADLAVLYATSPEPLEQRRRQVEPLVARLRVHHADHSALPRILARIERKLAHPASVPASQP